jgi:hypothetical protein
LLFLAGCSLVSFKSPERPLSERDVRARILTRDYSMHFIAAVEQCAAEIEATEDDLTILANALRWKIGAVSASQSAATQIAPMMSLLDTWTLALQMKGFLSEGNAGAAIFGKHQGSALAVASELADGADALARTVIAPGEFEKYRKFAAQYTREHPLENLAFVRASVVDLWTRESGADVKLVDAFGTIPEAMEDVGDRLKIYGDTLPAETIWRSQLALHEAGYSSGDLRTALSRLDTRLAKLSAAAGTAPELVQDAIADVRRSIVDVLNRMDASSAAMIKGFDVERVALTNEVRIEREAATVTIDAQRRAIAQDVARIADQVVQSSGEQVRKLTREVLLLLVLLAVVLLALPFGAGYFLGRARSRAPGSDTRNAHLDGGPRTNHL